MGKQTEISWTDHTFNPWWGCQRVSPGCEHCYAETLARRFGYLESASMSNPNPLKGAIWGPPKTTYRRTFGWQHWHEPFKWNDDAVAAGQRRRVFCASMADVFEANEQLEQERRRLWGTIRATPNLDWLLLTKRPENVATMLPEGYWSNVWLGTSTEDQQRADERVPVLRHYRNRVPVLFLSVEPQIGPVDLRNRGQFGGNVLNRNRDNPTRDGFIDWVIVGGESGPRHRPFNEDWARLLRDQCHAAGVAFHYKQFGGLHHAAGGCLLDGREWKEFPEPLPVAA